MKEEGPEILMDHDNAWLSVDIIQDIAKLEGASST